MFLSFSTAVSRSPPSPVLEAQGWRKAIWHVNIHNKSQDEKPTWLCPAREARHEFVCLTSAHQNWEVMYGTELNKVSGLRIPHDILKRSSWETWELGAAWSR